LRYLKHIVNSDRRDYYIRVNAVLKWLITWWGDRYPEPTHENVLHPNSHRLIDWQGEFFRDWNVRPNERFFRAIWRIAINKYEHSPPWRNMLDWLFMKASKDWKPWNPTRQMPTWRGK